MLNYYTSGESHGKCIITTISGLPYGIPINTNFINSELQRRQGGYGRSERMKVEKDRVEILSGIRNNKTIGGPITLMTKNKVANIKELDSITKPRPGHADLAGAMKFGINDARDISERASARETVGRVAAGALANYILSLFNIHTLGYVVEIGGITIDLRISEPIELKKRRSESIFYCLDKKFDSKIKKKIDFAKRQGDTLGGVFEVVAFNVPAGLGSFISWDTRLDGNIAKALMSVLTVKGVEIGLGFKVSKMLGSKVHDEIIFKENGIIGRTGNNAGGIEGGMSNGEPIVARAVCKPIPTLRKPLRTVDLESKKSTFTDYERSDICVIPSASVIGEAVVGFEIAKVFFDKFAGDTFEEVTERYNIYKEKLGQLFKKNG